MTDTPTSPPASAKSVVGDDPAAALRMVLETRGAGAPHLPEPGQTLVRLKARTGRFRLPSQLSKLAPMKAVRTKHDAVARLSGTVTRLMPSATTRLARSISAGSLRRAGRTQQLGESPGGTCSSVTLGRVLRS